MINSISWTMLPFTTGTTRSAGIKLYPKTASTNYYEHIFLLFTLPMELFTYNRLVSASEFNQIKIKNFSKESVFRKF